MQYAEFEEAKYEKFQTQLLNKDNHQFRCDFLENVRDTNKFLEYMMLIDKIDGEILPIFQERFTEDEFKDMRRILEQTIYKSWQNLDPAIACRASFWAWTTISHIKEGQIESHYLASNAKVTGKVRIDEVLLSDNPDKIERAIREILRNFSGVIERGNRTVYVDCIFGRAWWRSYTANIISMESNDNVSEIHELFSHNQKTHWAEFVSLVISRNSVLGDSSIRSAVVSCLLAIKNDIGDKKFYDGFAKKLSTIQRMIGVKQALQELGVMDINQLKDEFNKDIISKLF
ncbi:MAG: hypothetical protein K0U45_03450 [Alphaproteobacteria bacterium]|nr:hypothetical protein [Alphaproteobacteria bacterium]